MRLTLIVALKSCIRSHGSAVFFLSLPGPLWHCLLTDPQGGREDLHDFFCLGDLCGFFLLGESDLGCGSHGL